MQAPFAPVTADGGAPPRFGDPVVLLRPPYRVILSYAGIDRVWRSAWRQANELPRTIRLVVSDGMALQALSVSTVSVVHVQLPARCLAVTSLNDCIASGGKGPDAADPSKSVDLTSGQVR